MDAAGEDTTELPVVTQSAPPATAPAAAPARRRRWPAVLAWTMAGLVAFVLVVSAAGLVYVSGLIGDGARIAREPVPFDSVIDAVSGPQVTYSTSADATYPVDQGLMGLASEEGGYVQADPPRPGSTSGTAIRDVTAQLLAPPLQAGQPAALDSYYFPRNPLVGLGLSYEDVSYDAPLGPTPAWLIPGTSSTWVVFTHGRGATPAEGLRIAATAHELGHPVMLIRYRNDALAPPGNGYGQFGAQEWPDLEAAVQYALDRGAQRIVLAGASMGGSITLAFLQNSPLADVVVGAFLDAPATDFAQLVEDGAVERGLPAWLAGPAMTVASWRYGFDFATTDYTADAASFTTPMLIVQGTADTTVPADVNEAFAAAADPAVVRLELFEGAEHVMSWNVDRPRYEGLLDGFLRQISAAASTPAG